MTGAKYRQKWRPSLAMIVASMLAIIISLPIASLLLFKFYDSQLVRETESELIAQGVAISAIMQHLIRENEIPSTLLGSKVSADILPDTNAIYTPLLPTLELASEITLPPRPEARKPETATNAEFMTIGKLLAPIVYETKKKTLAGFRILDPVGRVISGHEEVGMSLAHVLEVGVALGGKYKSVIRQRISDEPLPPLASISRGTGIRIFAAMPVIINEQVAGVVYLSRTPSNVLKELYKQRWKVLFAGIFIVIVTLSIGFIFIRAVKIPIEKLQLRSEQIGRGEREALKPLNIHGSREIANLSNSMMIMAQKLFDRTDYINTFATHVSHELKSPLTSIQGAAELLRDQAGDMSNAQRKMFLANILEDTNRSVHLLDRLRELAKAENPVHYGNVAIKTILKELEGRFQKYLIEFSGDGDLQIGIALENAAIIFSNLIENAINHGATKINIKARQVDMNVIITVRDNGSGISSANADKVFELFFTTRRDDKGTGMGLGIVQAILKAHKGQIQLKSSSAGEGTVFEVAAPAFLP